METKTIEWGDITLHVTGEYDDVGGPDPDGVYIAFVVSSVTASLHGQAVETPELTIDELDEIRFEIEDLDRTDARVMEAEYKGEAERDRREYRREQYETKEKK